MTELGLDSIDRRLLDLLQAEFPLTKEPYADLGRQLGLGGDEVIGRIRQFKEDRLIRQISPVVDARSLGYQTTLVAMRVAGEQLKKAEETIARHPGVSHGYERDHHFNLWFTLAVPPFASVETELNKLVGSFEAESVMELPALKLFKLSVYFEMGNGDGQFPRLNSAPSASNLKRKAELSQSECSVINELQQDLPLMPRPFAEMSARLGMAEEDFLAFCFSIKQKGIIRRYGASVHHTRAGFKANAMTCWVARPDMVDVAGKEMASLRQVSHCYERRTNPLWKHNLFAMIHGHSREECQEVVDCVADKTGLSDYLLLYSTKEFKKSRVKYLV